MSASELLLTLVVALIVFSPSKLPMLASHLGILMRQINTFKKQATLLWQEQMHEIQLLENTKKAKEADEFYESCLINKSEQDMNKSEP